MEETTIFLNENGSLLYCCDEVQNSGGRESLLRKAGHGAHVPRRKLAQPGLEQFLANQKAQSTVWPLIKDNFASIVAKIPLIRKPQMPKMASAFCTAEDVADAKAFFESQADLMPGYERSLAQGVERGENCSALRAATADDVKAIFSED